MTDGIVEILTSLSEAFSSVIFITVVHQLTTFLLTSSDLHVTAELQRSDEPVAARLFLSDVAVNAA